MKTAVIYARVSSLGERQSTVRQVEDLKEYATMNGMEICRVFEEHVSGAKRNEEREVLQECLAYCETEKISIVLISELSRLGRNVDEILAAVKRCKDMPLNIYFQKENLSLFNADGSRNPFLNVFISILGTCAELEREAIKFRLNSGRKRYVDAGGQLGRKRGSVKTRDVKEVEYKNVIKELWRGTSIRRTAKLCDVSFSTVMRLKREFGL